MVGWLHKLFLDYKGTLIERDYRFFVERYVEILRRKKYPLADTYAALGAKFWERIKDWPVGVCHGDLHRGNLLETADGKIYLLDFDTVCKNFLPGYTHHINVTETEWASFNDWIVIRHFQLQATIVEIFGLDCIDNDFADRQLQWIRSWEEQLCAET